MRDRRLVHTRGVQCKCTCSVVNAAVVKTPGTPTSRPILEPSKGGSSTHRAVAAHAHSSVRLRTVRDQCLVHAAQRHIPHPAPAVWPCCYGACGCTVTLRKHTQVSHTQRECTHAVRSSNTGVGHDVCAHGLVPCPFLPRAVEPRRHFVPGRVYRAVSLLRAPPCGTAPTSWFCNRAAAV